VLHCKTVSFLKKNTESQRVKFSMLLDK